MRSRSASDHMPVWQAVHLSRERRRGASLHFWIRTRGWGGWSDSRNQNRGWNFTQNIPDNGSFDLGGRRFG